MKHAVFLVLVLLALAIVSNAQGLSIGAKMVNFSMPGIDGKVRTLNELQGKNGAVIVFLSAQCPVVKSYNARINEIVADYRSKGINFIGINSNSTESLEWVKSDVAEVGYKFPVLIDKGNKFADLWGATVTPEIYFVDANSILLYHGAIDNDRSGKAVSEQYLRSAFDQTLAGKMVVRTTANAFGCSIKRVSE
ncbi:MAG TPA: redoxin domain-containing protein [Pyrinomonadaceae bacterium]|nr:redoxin domain-containing protein [Chloracidobacterium sp.]MBP9935906.1 redoxin domain-containing protein [Pyrinomonadaceae bacterium]MBK7801114.1 redoxin domain-containing protein [Chloracidobacterium sp.]MBK9767308.1 redoxin domain-containing protein [Chloracidobacterium sp.]MBL0241420.1 redoxin domain-containing protein [Chloracidobacterium sp.]